MIKIKTIHSTLTKSKADFSVTEKSIIQLTLIRERSDLNLAKFCYFKCYLNIIKGPLFSIVYTSFHLPHLQSMALGSHFYPEEPWSPLLHRKTMSTKASLTSELL